MSTNDQEITRRPNVRLSAFGLTVIDRAITLRLAMCADDREDSPEVRGQALANICGEWLRTQHDLLKES